MGQCGECGRPIRADARFCGHCGVQVPSSAYPEPVPRSVVHVAPPSGAEVHAQPAWPVDRFPQPISPPGGRKGRNLRVWSSAAAVLVAVAGAVLFAGRSGRDASEPEVPRSAPTVQPIPVSPPAVPRTQPSAPVADGDLGRQVDADRAVAEGLVGSWIPQLSSRRLGMVINGVPADAATIARDFADSEQRYPESILVRSEDYSSFRQRGYFVTLLAVPFSSAAEANAWCDSTGRGPDDCFAKRLSHTEGPAGNTVHR